MATAVFTLSSVRAAFPADGVIVATGKLAVSNADYATGGLTVTNILRGGDIKTVATKPLALMATSIAGYNFAYDYTNAKVLFFDGATQVAAGAVPAGIVTNGLDFVAWLDPGNSAK